MTLGIALLSVAWSGLLYALSPCPLTTNLAAVSLIARQSGSSKRLLLCGFAYALGRVLAYEALALLLLAGLASAPELSQFLQREMARCAGPLLVLVGAVLLDLLPHWRLPKVGLAERLRKLSSCEGLSGIFTLGVLLTLAFCPTSAALFFGGLLPLAMETGSFVLLPCLFGLAATLPLLLVAASLAFAAGQMARWLNRVATFERWAKRATALLSLAIGLYLCCATLF